MPETRVPASVRLADLRIGELLAEGGEGRVFQLPLQPHLIYKAYRKRIAGSHLEELVAWPDALASSEAAARVSASSAWPCAVVAGPAGDATGLLAPRAPRRFSVRHRDGHSRLASLSYLTADPGHRSAAYGLRLPAPGSPERVGLVYALARLLAAFESVDPGVAHGDLSTKNVLWSLQRAPEVFVIDCDNSERFTIGGESLGDPGRRRAMTPNWDDPAVEKGASPTPATDRYSLALVFLRIVGAANFPIQARQRSGGPVVVDFTVPPGPAAGPLLDPGAAVWELCARGLSVTDPARRPSAAAWVSALEATLDSMDAGPLAHRTRAAQGGGPVTGAVPPPRGAACDVEIRPVLGTRPVETRWARVSVAPGWSNRPSPTGTPAGGLRWVPVGAPAQTASAQLTVAPGRPAPTATAGPDPAPSIWPEIRAGVHAAAEWWITVHRHMLRALLDPARRGEGVRSLLFCGLVDVMAAVLGLFFVAMVVAPVVGI